MIEGAEFDIRPLYVRWLTENFRSTRGERKTKGPAALANQAGQIGRQLLAIFGGRSAGHQSMEAKSLLESSLILMIEGK